MICQRLSGIRGIQRKAAGRMPLLTAAGLVMFFVLAAWSFTGTATGAPAGPAGKNPFEGKPDAIKEGENLFDAKCADCHGGDAMGQSGPDLTDNTWIYGGSDAEVYESVADGRKGGMPSWRSELGKDDVWKVIAYVRSLKKK